jgi:large subunit ribosomal protein L25
MRRDGRIPAVLYGRNTQPLSLSVDQRDFEHVTKQGGFGQLLFKLAIENGKKIKKSAMVWELQTHPVTGDVLHIDFYEIDMRRKIRVDVPVTTVGQAVGVEMGGMLQVVRRELEVLCLPGQIPDEIKIDISALEVGDSVHVEEIALEGDVEIVHDVNFTVLTILSPKREAPEEEEAAEEELAEEVAEGEDAAEAEAEE